MTKAENDKNRARSTADRLKQTGVEAKRTNGTAVYPEDLTLVTDPNHWLYDPRVEEALSEDFIEDIKVNGVLKPVIVRENGKGKGGKTILQVVAGRRRTMHAVELNKRLAKAGEDPRMIDVKFATGTDTEILLLALSENAHTKSESYLSRAIKVRNALNLKATKDQVRRAISCAPNTIDDLLAFLNLSKEARDAIEGGKVPFGSTRALAELPREEQPQTLVDLAEVGATKTHEIREALNAKREGREYTPPEVKKVLARKKIEDWAAVLREEFKDEEDCQVAFKVLSFVLGYKKSLRGHPNIRKAAEMAAIELTDPEPEAASATENTAPGRTPKSRGKLNGAAPQETAF